MENPLDKVREEFPQKFASERDIFSHIHRGDRIFISSACAEPQYLVNALIRYTESYPKAFFDTEVIHIWTLGLAPYTEKRFKYNFRHNSFFIGDSTRNAVNQGLADYTPVFFSEIPSLFARKQIPIDAALIQTSPPDEHGYMSLGVSVDIVKAAIDQSSLIIASGDRSDYLASALIASPSGIVVTNNILPPPYLLAKLSERNIPVLLVPYDTYETAKQIDEMAPLLTRDDSENIQLLEKLITQNVDIQSII